MVTTIQSPTESFRALEHGSSRHGWDLIVIGDEPGPQPDDYRHGLLFTLDAQMNLPFSLGRLLPKRHYSRKNIGYLIAALKGCEIIVETDDDNFPLAEFWRERSATLSAEMITASGWYNVYQEFSRELLWPRGMPLQFATAPNPGLVHRRLQAHARAPIQQGLANGDPDVDSVYRMLIGKSMTFDDRSPVVLGHGTWCPFNSQNTTWFREAFPLMYLPSTCTFRMTDIWRSFIAQRIAWARGLGVAFTNASVRQDRNQHDLLRDFADEVPGFLRNAFIAESLSGIRDSDLRGDIGDALIHCYEVLCSHRIFDENEMQLVQAWVEDLRKMPRA